jgi:hypothetical protein
MHHQATGIANHYALRIEGRAWLDDLTIDQVWAVLKAAFQQLEPQQELMFMTLLPNGEMPSRCLPRSVFDLCMRTPSMLADALSSLMPPSRDDRASALPAGDSGTLKLSGLS